VTYAALAPNMEIIAPAREWGMTREQEIDYAAEHGIPLPMTKANPYSTDTNLWGRSIEAGVIEDPSREAPADAWQWTVEVAAAPEAPTYVKIDFEQGVPVALDGERLTGATLVGRLNELGGANAIGRIDMLENRPGGHQVARAVRGPRRDHPPGGPPDLEAMTLDRENRPFQALPGATLRRAGLLRPLVHPPARSDRRLPEGDAKARNRPSNDEAVTRAERWQWQEKANTASTTTAWQRTTRGRIRPGG